MNNDNPNLENNTNDVGSSSVNENTFLDLKIPVGIKENDDVSTNKTETTNSNNVDSINDTTSIPLQNDGVSSSDVAVDKETELKDERFDVSTIVSDPKEEDDFHMPVKEEEKTKLKISPFGDVRYNPVTGEELNINDVKDEVNNVEKLKTVEIEAKPASKASSVLLVLFFIFLLGFIIYLPDLVVIIDAYKAGKGKIVTEDVPTGKLICNLETNTVNLDRTIERVFYYEDLKLKSSKFSTTIRGDVTLDEESLSELYSQCNQIKDGVQGLDGVSISCEFLSDMVIEKESFDYSNYDSQKISSAYVEAGGSMIEFQYDQDIDKVASNMRQGGFKCSKEK